MAGDPHPGMTAEEYAAIDAYAAEVAAKAPPPTLELIARLRPIFAAAITRRATDAA